MSTDTTNAELYDQSEIEVNSVWAVRTSKGIDSGYQLRVLAEHPDGGWLFQHTKFGHGPAPKDIRRIEDWQLRRTHSRID